MRVLLAGATGALGRRLLPQLLAAGHDVTATTRSPEKLPALRAAGATSVLMEGLDPASVDAAVAVAMPDAVVHQMTDLASLGGNLRRFDEEFVGTNRLRTTGTDLLLAAARSAGARRFVAQSFTGWPNEQSGSWVKDEDDPLDPSPAPASVRTMAAIRHVEQVVPAAALYGLVLRYGGFYGPGTSLDRDGEMTRMVARRRLPVVGSGEGRFSFVHVDDAASATVAALENGDPGVYNVVDDEPAPVAQWLPHLADVLGAKPPRRVPAWVARPLVGEFAVRMMTCSRGSSNAKARTAMDWRPRYATWREGFRAELGTVSGQPGAPGTRPR